MNKNTPAWALRAATSDDYDVVQAAQRQRRLSITWPEAKTLRIWAKEHGWPTPWFSFEEAFIANMLETKANFELAMTKSGIALTIPKQQHTLSAETLRAFDALYDERSDNGRPSEWGSLVEELREIRRAVEAGVAVQVEGEQITLNERNFYNWAHGRYHMLEDGYDKWIGDDA